MPFTGKLVIRSTGDVPNSKARDLMKVTGESLVLLKVDELYE